MNDIKVLLCTPDDGVMTRVIQTVLRQEGFEPRIVVVADKDDTGAIRHEMADTDVVYPNKALIGAGMIACAPRLRLIHCGTGYDTVDCAAATERGVVVCSTGPVMARSTAEHTLFLLLALARNGGRVFQEMEAGQWHRRMGWEMSGKVLGLIGFGHIGSIVARMARGLGMEVVASRRNWQAGGADGVRFVQLEHLLDEADVLSIHAPLISSGADCTRGLLGAARLQRFGQHGLGWIINTARGAIIEEAALLEALRNGTVRKAALDVFSDEPLAQDHPLRTMPNVILTPHVAGETIEALEARYTVIARNAARVLRGEQPDFQVNPVPRRPIPASP